VRLVIVFVVAAAFVCQSVHAGDIVEQEGEHNYQVSNSDVVLKVEGSSGKIRLRRPGKDNDVEVSFDRIQEIDSDSRQRAVQALDTKDFVWSAPTSETVNGVPTTRIEFNGTLDDSSTAWIQVITWLYSGTGTVEHGGVTYTVGKDFAKFTVHIRDWPFKEVGNRLRLMMELKVNGGSYTPDDIHDKSGSGDTDSDTDDGSAGKGSDGGNGGNSTGSGSDESSSSNKGKSCNLKDVGVIEFAPYAVVDGVTTNITAEIYSNDNNKNGVAVIFPYFTSYVDYDPSLFINAASLARPHVAVITAMAALLAFVFTR